jgi:hypothetical protein
MVKSRPAASKSAASSSSSSSSRGVRGVGDAPAPAGLFQSAASSSSSSSSRGVRGVGDVPAPAGLFQSARKSTVAVSGLSHAFFSGKIRDRTTPEACSAARKLAILGNKNKNPEWSPRDLKA